MSCVGEFELPSGIWFNGHTLQPLSSQWTSKCHLKHIPFAYNGQFQTPTSPYSTPKILIFWYSCYLKTYTLSYGGQFQGPKWPYYTTGILIFDFQNVT